MKIKYLLALLLLVLISCEQYVPKLMNKTDILHCPYDSSVECIESSENYTSWENLLEKDPLMQELFKRMKLHPKSLYCQDNSDCPLSERCITSCVYLPDNKGVFCRFDRLNEELIAMDENGVCYDFKY